MISVIVPVYQTERYLSRCIDSILNQTYRDFELLLIDDGSTDDSGAICDRYARQDSRVHTFHKENGGLSDARNYGLDHATGNYYAFVDSDDYIGRNYLKILMEMASENDADMAIISLQRVKTDDTVFIESTDRRTIYTGKELFYELVKGSLIETYVCTKLFKAELLKTIRFPKGKTYEDLATIPYIACDCRRCIFSTSIQYYYCQRSDSITHCPTDSNMQNWLDATEKLLNYTLGNYPEIFPYAASRLAKHMFYKAIDWRLFSNDYYDLATSYRNKLKIYLKETTFLPGLNKKEIIKLEIFIFSVRLYRIVRILWIRFSRNPDNKLFLSEHSV